MNCFIGNNSQLYFGMLISIGVTWGWGAIANTPPPTFFYLRTVFFFGHWFEEGQIKKLG
jgi:hypothetical protein